MKLKQHFTNEQICSDFHNDNQIKTKNVHLNTTSLDVNIHYKTINYLSPNKLYTFTR